MKPTKFLGFDCVSLENSSLELLVTQSVGPRIISLRFKGGENVFAELPDQTEALPDGKVYHLYGGHRLWHAPEHMPRSYVLDDDPVEISALSGGLVVSQASEALSGIQKSMQISLSGQEPRITVQHTLTNQGVWPVEFAPWAITQLKPGGVAILPQPKERTGLLPSRCLAIWPYSDMNTPQVQFGHDYIFIHARMHKPFKLGFPNPRGWLAYWRAGVLFVKKATFNPLATYCDYGSSSECFCNQKCLELETLAPLTRVSPGAAVHHTETWELHALDDFQADEASAQEMADRFGLE